MAGSLEKKGRIFLIRKKLFLKEIKKEIMLSTFTNRRRRPFTLFHCLS